MIRVLHVIKGLDAGGAETLLLLAAAHRDRAAFDYEVAHLLPSHVALRPAIEAEDVVVHDLHGTPGYDPRWVARLRRLLADGGFDVVHAHSPLVAAGTRVAARSIAAERRPVVVTTLHNVWESHHWATRFMDAATARLDATRIAVSEAVRRSAPPRMRSRIVTEVHGVDVDTIRRDADREAVRDELGLQTGDIVVGTVANLKAHKAYEDMLEAASILTAVDGRVNFVSIGDGPLLEEMERRRDALGLGERFRFLGHRADARRLVSGFDVFCLSSRHEGMSIALMEALVLGVPVVVTDVGGARELVDDGVEGLLVEPSRPAELAAALGRLADDGGLRRRMSAAARRRGDALRVQEATASIEDHYRRSIGR